MDASTAFFDDARAVLRRLRWLSRLLDEAVTIPGTNFRVGLDPILGLVPGAGDVAGLALGAYIVAEAYRLGAPPVLLARMVLNLLVDLAVGLVPVLGDLFDIVWKANVSNLRLLEAYLGLEV